MHGLVDVAAALREGHVLALEEVGGAAEVTAVGTAQAGGDVPHHGVLLVAEDLDRRDGSVGVAERPRRRSPEQPPHEADAFFAADVIAEGAQHLSGSTVP